MTDPDEGYVSWATESETDSDYKSGKTKSARPKGHSAPKPKPKPKVHPEDLARQRQLRLVCAHIIIRTPRSWSSARIILTHYNIPP